MTGRPRKLSPAEERMLKRKYLLGRRLTPSALRAQYQLSASGFFLIVGRKREVDHEAYLRRKVRNHLCAEARLP